MIDKAYFERVFIHAVNMLRKLAPKDTGNLAFNSIKYRWRSSNTFEIYVDMGDGDASKKMSGIAPYMPFTNEPWISPRWNGKQNPNEQWWNKACKYVMTYISKELGGKLKYDYNKTDMRKFGKTTE